MGKTKKIIKAVGISTAIILSNAKLTAAEEPSSLDSVQETQYPNLNQSDSVKSKNSEVLLSAKALPESIGVNKLGYYPDDLANKSVVISTPIKISQSNPSPRDINEPAQQPIPDAQELNPNSNPLSFPTQSEEVKVDIQQPITLEQAIELALQNNRNVQISRLNVQRAEEAVKQAKAALLPTIALDSNLSYSDSAFADSITEQSIDQRFEESREAARNNPLDNRSDDEIRADVESSFTNTNSNSFTFGADLVLSYSLYNGGERGATIRRSEKQLRFNKLDLERIVEQIRLDTSSNYYNLQNSDARVNIEQAAVEDAQQTLKDAQLLEKAGLGTRFDVLRAEVELANAEQRLTTAKANQDTARRQLAQTLSVGEKVDLKTADAIEEAGDWNFSLEETIVQAYKNRAELEQFLLQREINDEERKIALAQVRPNVTLQARYGLNDDFEDNFDVTDQYSVGANLQWTLFDGGAARAAAKQEETDKEIAEAEFANQRNEVRLEVEQSFFGLQANKKNIVTAEKAVELAEESLRLARLRFQAGVGTQTDVIDAQTELTTARGNLLSAIIEYNQSYAQLQRAVTNLPDGGLSDLP
ncbi:MAG: TolC family protein [Pleurocapsa sp.]